MKKKTHAKRGITMWQSDRLRKEGERQGWI